MKKYNYDKICGHTCGCENEEQCAERTGRMPARGNEYQFINELISFIKILEDVDNKTEYTSLEPYWWLQLSRLQRELFASLQIMREQYSGTPIAALISEFQNRNHEQRKQKT